MCRLPEFLRSLTVKHVLFSDLIQKESGCRALCGSAVPDALAIARKWFWSRKVGEGFVLEGFPRNLSQALVFDEWSDARGETIDRVIHLKGNGRDDQELTPVVLHYQRQSILEELTLSDLDRMIAANDRPEVALS